MEQIKLNIEKLRRALKMSGSRICKILNLHSYDPTMILYEKDVNQIEYWLRDECEKNRWQVTTFEPKLTMINMIINHGWWKKYE